MIRSVSILFLTACAALAFPVRVSWALPSVPITLAAPSGRIFAVTIQASTDAATWQNVTMLLPEEITANGQLGPRLFIRKAITQ